MHQHDGDRANAVVLGAFQFAAYRVEIDLALDAAVGANALVDLHHALVQHVRLDDVAREDFRPRLIADAQRVAKSLGDQKERAFALALQQRIGGDRGAHLDRVDPLARDRRIGRKPEQVANAVHRRVAVGLGIFRKQFMRGEAAVGTPADHVGKGTAAIDPELPAP